MSASVPGFGPAAPEHAGSNFKCDSCLKQFGRKCDLTKHAKVHIRPFKCSVESCRFHNQGWPTEKELERHYNDKHSPTPRMVSCSFSGCNYMTKRDSNCKQHMEKAHNWVYVRKRPSKLYTCPYPGCTGCASNEESQRRHATQPVDYSSVQTAMAAAPWNVPTHPGPNHPEINVAASSQLYHGPAAPDSLLEPAIVEARPANPSGGRWSDDLESDGRESEAFLVWDSPPTKLKKMERVLSQLHQTLFPPIPQDGPPDSEVARDDMPFLSPAIKASGSPESLHPLSAPVWEQSRAPFGDQPDAQTIIATPYHGTYRAPSTGHETRPRSKRGIEHVSAGGAGGHGDHAGEKDDEDSEEDAEGDDEDDEDDEPRRKRTKASSEDSFDDARMECPFRLANPDVYSRERNQKYSPCYTTHSQISTIVRHFKRAAHKLNVEEAYVSSFDIPSNGEAACYPAAGLCRRCWKSFTNRDEFDHHLLQQCARVSRSKREKFRLLLETFCVPVRRDDSASKGAGAASAKYRGLPYRTASTQRDTWQQRRPPTPSVLSPGNVSGADVPPAQGCDSLTLPERVEALEKRTSMLFVMIKTMAAAVRDATAGQPSHGDGGDPGLVRRARREETAVARGTTSPPKRTGSLPSDRESLVGGMDSQSTDVDRDGLIQEVTRTLTNRSSGTDRSAVRHVQHVEIQDLHGRADHVRQDIGALVATAGASAAAAATAAAAAATGATTATSSAVLGAAAAPADQAGDQAPDCGSEGRRQPSLLSSFLDSGFVSEGRISRVAAVLTKEPAAAQDVHPRPEAQAESQVPSDFMSLDEEITSEFFEDAMVGYN